MQTRSLTAVLILTLLAACQSRPSRRELGGVKRRSPTLDALVHPSARFEVLAEGFEWSEGPLWIPEDGGYVLFSDIPPNRVMKWQRGRGLSVYLEQSGYLGPIPRPGHIAPDEPGSNGLLLDPRGRLVLCQHGARGCPPNAPPLLHMGGCSS